MTIQAFLRQSRDNLLEALYQEEHQHALARRALADAAARREQGLRLLDDAIQRAHDRHPDKLSLCRRGICVDLRKARAAL